MRKLVFIGLWLLSSYGFAEPLSLKQSLQEIETSWAKTHYGLPEDKQLAAYLPLIDKAEQLLAQYPHNTEVMFCIAMIKSSMAAHENPARALAIVNEVRDLLTKVVTINPNTMQGSAYVILGTLYYRVPSWPISFGDKRQAEEMLTTALRIHPEGIDTNYFYGQFLLDNNQRKEARHYFKKALDVPLRPEQRYADEQLKNEARQALDKLEQQG